MKYKVLIVGLGNIGKRYFQGICKITDCKIDVFVFDKLRDKYWFIPPLASSINGSVIDTFLFFSIAFYATGIPWFTLALGDLMVKLFVALLMLLPFRLLLKTFKPV